LVLSRYEAQSLEVDYYFPNLTSVAHIKETLHSKVRKQSLYFDVSDFDQVRHNNILVNGEEDNVNGTNMSDNEGDQTMYRLRSGTDISDSIQSARQKAVMKKRGMLNRRRTTDQDPSVLELLKEDKSIKNCVAMLPYQNTSSEKSGPIMNLL